MTLEPTDDSLLDGQPECKDALLNGPELKALSSQIIITTLPSNLSLGKNTIKSQTEWDCLKANQLEAYT